MKRQLISILCAAALTCSAGAASMSDFSDVRPADWYSAAVNYVCEKGLMNGTSNTTFSPNTTTSRGMIVTILYRLAGSPDMRPKATGATHTQMWTRQLITARRSTGRV